MEIKIRVEENKQNINLQLKDSIVVYFAGEPQIKEVEYVENGEYSVEADAKCDLEEVKIKVNVPIPEGYLKPEGTLDITKNGEVDVKKYASVNVDIDTRLPEQEKTLDVSQNGTYSIIPDKGKVLSTAFVNVNVPDIPTVLQEKSITPRKEVQYLTPDSGYEGMSKVTIEPIPDNYIEPTGTKVLTENGKVDITEYKFVDVDVQPDLENIEITPTKEEQHLNSKNAYGFNNVVVKPIPDEYIIPKGTLDITENKEYDITNYKKVNVDVPIPEGYIIPEGTKNINANGKYDITSFKEVDVDIDTSKPEQSKTSTPTKEMQQILPDTGYVLNEVIVNPIPEEYIVPSGTLDITENGEYDITDKSSVNVNVASSGSGEDMLQARIDATNTCGYLFYYYGGTNVDFIKNLNTSKVTGMHYMFYGCNKLTSIPQLNTSNVTNMNRMFSGCTALTSIPQLDTSKVTDMNNIFSDCSILTSIPQLDTSKVTDMKYMFYRCKALISIPQLNTSKAIAMDSMFRGCTNLTSIPQLDTSIVTSMAYMFEECKALTSIPQLDTSKVTDMNRMFSNCNKLTSIPQLNTSKVTNMTQMFYACNALTSIPQLDTSKVTNNNYMSNAFGYCYNLKSLLTYGMKVKFDISASTKFEASDLVTILSNCQVITSSQTLTMKSTNLAKLEGVYVKPTGVELYEGISCNPCVICESTEEGAILATDYFTAKGWTLA